MIQLSHKNVCDKNAHPNRKQKKKTLKKIKRIKKTLILIWFLNHPIDFKIKEPAFVFFFLIKKINTI